MSAGVVVRLEQGEPPVVPEQPSRPPAPHAHLFVARDRESEQPLGVVHLEPGPDDFAELVGLTVLPAARRRGVARRLVTAAEAFARVHRMRTLRVRIEPDGAPVARALGFTEIDPFSAYVGDGDGVFFAKAL